MAHYHQMKFVFVSIRAWFISKRLVHFPHQHAAVFALFNKQKTETIWQSVSPAEKIYISLFITPGQLLSNCCHRSVGVRSIITINNRGNEWCAFEAAGWVWKKVRSLKQDVLKTVCNKSDYRLVCVHILRSRDHRYPPCNEEARARVITAQRPYPPDAMDAA